MSRVFFIPSVPNAPTVVGHLTERLRSTYGDEAVPVGRWGLEHKLMRDTLSCLPASAHAPNPVPRARYLQFLSVSNYPKLGFIYASVGGADELASTTSSGMIMRAVPQSSSAELFKHFVRAAEPLWCHRHTITVTGTTYEVGDFRVRIGEVRQTLPFTRGRGTVMEIEWRGPSLLQSASISPRMDDDSDVDDDDDNGKGEEAIDSGVDVSYVPTDAEIDAEYMQTAQMIREFWMRLAVANKNTSEAILVPDTGKELKAKLHQRREPRWRDREVRRRQKRREAIAIEGSWGAGVGGGVADAEEDVVAGVDLARQYMEIFRFTR